MTMPSALEYVPGMENWTPEQMQEFVTQQGQPYNPQAGLEKGKPLYDSKGNFIGFGSDAGPLPQTFGMDLPPEQLLADIEEQQLSRQQWYEQGAPRYFAEQQARSTQELRQWEADLKKQNPELFEVYRKGGRTPEERAEALKKEVAKRNEDFENKLKSEWPEGYKIYKEQGVNAYNKAVDDSLATYAAALKALEPYKTKEGDYSIVAYLKKNPGTQQVLRDAGFKDSDIEDATLMAKPFLQRSREVYADYKKAEDAMSKASDKIWAEHPSLSEGEKIKLIKASPEYTKFQEMSQKVEKYTVTPEKAGIFAAEMIVPGVFLARHWNEMSATWKAIYIVIDVGSVIPFVGAAARGARTVSTAGRLARLGGAVEGIIGEVGAQIRAPVDMIIHPIGTGKTTLQQVRNLVETLAHPKKLPEAVITTADGLVMLRVNETTSPAQAMAIRDKLMELVAKGERPIVKIGDQTIELARSPLMREAGGGLAHATPDIELLAGARVKPKPGFPAKEQGWFLSNEPAPRFTESGAFPGTTTPVPSKATSAVEDVAKFRPRDLVRVDKYPIRELNFADAKNIPEKLAKPLQDYARREQARLYGSFNDWLKVKGAARPNDIDLAFIKQDKAIQDVLRIAENAGFKAKRVEHGVAILKDGEWVKLGDIDSIAHHRAILPNQLSQSARSIDGINVEHLGEQYLRQSYGAVAKDAKAATRTKKLAKAASDVKKLLKAAGAEEMKPGIFIVSPETATRAVSSQKLWHQVAEMEKKLVIGEDIPKPKQKLFTRLGPTSRRTEIWLEKPLSARQIAKLKAEGLIEVIKTPFKPAITIKGKGPIVGLTTSQTQKLSSILRASGNRNQARSLLRTIRLVRASRVAPTALSRIVGKVNPRDIRNELKRLGVGATGRARPERPAVRERATIRAPRLGTRAPRLPRTEERVTRLPERATREGRPPRETVRGREVPRTREVPRGRETPREIRPPREVPRPPRPPRPPERPPERPPLGRDAPDRVKREYIQKSEGAIAFRMGELHNKDVWHVIVEPYQDRRDYLAVIGAAPRGAREIRGPQSAYKTAQVLYGPKLTKPISLDIGVTDVLLEPMPGKQGVSISFRGDPHLSTTSDINISKRVGPITKSGNIRITPKFQRLR